MSEQKRSTMTVVVIAGAALGLCCVGSVAAAVLFGVGAPAALLLNEDFHDDGVAVRAPVAAAPSLGLEGTWSRGAKGLAEFRDAASERWASPSGEGARYVFFSDGTCELDGLAQTTSGACTSWVFTSTTSCRWSLAGTALTVTLGEGVQRSKPCDGALTEGVAKPRTMTATITLEQDRLTMVSNGATFTLNRER